MIRKVYNLISVKKIGKYLTQDFSFGLYFESLRVFELILQDSIYTVLKKPIQLRPVGGKLK
jgi:hypothetical protein